MTPSSRQSVIPSAAWMIAGVVAAFVFLLLSIAVTHAGNLPEPLPVFIPLLAAAALGGHVLLLGYIYGDARRRGMRYVLWTLLALIAPSAIGIILYFILRDPRQVHCTRCGCSMNPAFAYCPRCGSTMSATCIQCHKVAQPGWSHCAWCGGKL